MEGGGGGLESATFHSLGVWVIAVVVGVMEDSTVPC